MKSSPLSLLFLPIFLPVNLYATDLDLEKWPSFGKEVSHFCEANPYDCKSNEIVSPYKLNTFLRGFYLRIEEHFAERGFENAIFEFCQGYNSLRYYSARYYSACLTEGFNVKNSNNPLSITFPKRDKYFLAFGGVNQNLGVHFIKELEDDEANQLCSVVTRQGNELSNRARKALASGDLDSITELKSRYYRKYRIELVQYLPTIWGINPSTILPDSECWLTKNEKKIVFETVKEAL